MTTTRARPREGLSLSCAATEHHSFRRPCRASGYVPELIFEALNAHCWYRQISQSEFVATLVVAQLEQLQQCGQLTPNIIELYRTTRLQPPLAIH